MPSMQSGNGVDYQSFSRYHIEARLQYPDDISSMFGLSSVVYVAVIILLTALNALAGCVSLVTAYGVHFHSVLWTSAKFLRSTCVIYENNNHAFNVITRWPCYPFDSINRKWVFSR